jgi:hypothetical protein
MGQLQRDISQFLFPHGDLVPDGQVMLRLPHLLLTSAAIRFALRLGEDVRQAALRVRFPWV